MIETRNASFKLVENLVFQGIVKPIELPNGYITALIDLTRFSEYFGFTIPQNAFRFQGDTRFGPGRLMSLIPTSIEDDTLILPTKQKGFINKVDSKIFISSLQNGVLNQLVRLILTPLHGRDVLLRIDLINELRKEGSSLTSSFKNSQEIVLKDGKPAIIFEKLEDQEVDLEIDGEKVRAPLCNPYLIVNSVSRIMAVIHVAEKLSFETLGNITYKPGNIEIESNDLSLHAHKQVEIASRYVYSGFNTTGIDKV